ncbi:glycosyltransferase family 2 protein, partial [Bacillus cereus]
MKKRILIGSPINQKENILKEFLMSLQELETDELEVSYYFIDDNEESNSSALLEKFALEKENVLVLEEKNLQTYQRDENSHYWNEDLIWKVAKYKNKIIDKMLEEEYDYLFFVDSDLVLHPKTLQHLVQLNKDIVAEIFWTKWEKNNVELPQVWLYDHYTLYEHHREEVLEEKEIQRRTLEFLNMLKKPGVYEVGGLGACTLFSRSALEKGVNFSKIKNVTMWGEDRHLSIRAAALGIRLFVDSHFPAYHIYRDSELKGVKNYKQQYRKQMETKVKDYILDTVITVMEMYLDIGISPFEEENRNTSVSKMFLSLLKNQNELQLVTK